MSSTDPCMSVRDFICPTHKPILTLSPVSCLLTQSIIPASLCAIERTITSANGRKWTYQCCIMSDGVGVSVHVGGMRELVSVEENEFIMISRA